MQPAVATKPAVPVAVQPGEAYEAALVWEPGPQEALEEALTAYGEESNMNILNSNLPFAETTVNLQTVAEEMPVPDDSSSSSEEMELETAGDSLAVLKHALQTSLLNTQLLDGLVCNANAQTEAANHAVDLLVLELKSVQAELLTRTLAGNLAQTKLDVALVDLAQTKSDIVALRRSLKSSEESLRLFNTLNANTARVEQLAARAFPARRSLNEVALDDNASASLGGPPYDVRDHSVGRTFPGITMGPPYIVQDDSASASLSDPSYDATDHSASASGSTTTPGAPIPAASMAQGSRGRTVHWADEVDVEPEAPAIDEPESLPDDDIQIISVEYVRLPQVNQVAPPPRSKVPPQSKVPPPAQWLAPPKAASSLETPVRLAPQIKSAPPLPAPQPKGPPPHLCATNQVGDFVIPTPKAKSPPPAASDPYLINVSDAIDEAGFQQWVDNRGWQTDGVTSDTAGSSDSGSSMVVNAPRLATRTPTAPQPKPAPPRLPERLEPMVREPEPVPAARERKCTCCGEELGARVEDTIALPCAHTFCKPCVIKAVCEHGITTCFDCRREIGADWLVTIRSWFTASLIRPTRHQTGSQDITREPRSQDIRLNLPSVAPAPVVDHYLVGQLAPTSLSEC